MSINVFVGLLDDNSNKKKIIFNTTFLSLTLVLFMNLIQSDFIIDIGIHTAQPM